MNNDFLRLNNKNEEEKKQGVLDSRDVDVEIPQNIKKGIFDLPKPNNAISRTALTEKLPSQKKVVISFCLMLILSFALFFASFLIQSVETLFSAAAILSLTFPFLLYFLFSGLTEKGKGKITIFDFAVCFLCGAVAAVLSGVFGEKVSVLVGGTMWLAEVFSSLFSDLLLLTLCFIVVMIKKKDDLTASVNLVALIFVGYVFIKTFSGLSARIYSVLNSANKNDIGYLSDRSISLESYSRQLISIIFYEGLFNPFILSLWCFVYAWFIGLFSLPVKLKQNQDIFAPIAIFVQLVLHVLLSINWSWTALNWFIRVFTALIFSAYSIRVIFLLRSDKS
ncbi:MAG: hypothetical protein IJ800_00085 [Clostridia bacterium]|nr:hypothetical protein [Clostridia bacterium]